jgi:hypothetical protein
VAPIPPSKTTTLLRAASMKSLGAKGQSYQP